MENFYTAYTRVVQNKTFYFVKTYLTFPEFKDLPGILESYGMHTDFNKACRIARINDMGIRKQLLEDLQVNPNGCKVIHMNTTQGVSAAQ